MNERTPSITRTAFEALAAGACTMLGLELGMQLTDPSSTLRLKLAELAERVHELEHTLREAWIRRAVDDLIADAATEAPSTATEESTP